METDQLDQESVKLWPSFDLSPVFVHLSQDWFLHFLKVV